MTILAAIPAVIIAYPDGAPDRVTGAPGDAATACVTCHLGTALNGGGGRVEITYSGGTSYTPGQQGKFTVTITDSAAQRYGFEASARLASNLQNGQAGTLTAAAGTRVICDGGGSTPCRATAPVQFITHSAPKTTNSFEFDWMPPAAGAGDVRVYVAGNAAAGRTDSSGDHIYTANITLTEASAGGGARPSLSSAGIVNNWSFQAGVSSKTWVSIYGQNLAATTTTWAGAPEFAQGKLPTTVGGVSVTVNGKPAPILSVSPGQVNILAPDDDATGNVQVVLKTASGEGTTTTTRAQFLPSLNSTPIGTTNTVIAVVNGTSTLVGADLAPIRPVRPGETIQFYGTGFGPVTPNVASDSLVQTGAIVNASTLAIRINNVPVQILGSAYVSPGLCQINGVIPEVPDGSHVITVEVGGVRSPDNVFIQVRR